MKRIFCLLCLLTCVGVSHAATMCVSDLSTCESCTDFEELAGTGYVLGKANCCGVPVVLLWGAKPSYGYSENRSFDLSRYYDVFHTPGNTGFDVCMMVAPFVAPYAVVVEHGGIASGVFACAGFIPRCAFTYCDEAVELGSGDWGAGGAD